MSRAFWVGAGIVVACGGTSTSSAPVDAGSSGSDAAASASSSSGGSSGTASSSSSGGSSSSSGATSSSGGAPVPPMSFVVRKIFLGESDRTGTASRDAWQAYGRNVDGLVTVATSSTSPDLAKVCKRRSGAPPSVQNDGPSGLDDSWGKNVIPLFQPFDPTPSKTTTTAVENGARTPMMALSGNGGSFVYAETTASTPTWAADEKRPVAADWLNGTTPKTVISVGGVGADGFYDSGVLANAPLVILAFMQGQALGPLALHAANVRMKISADMLTATEGILSGVVATEELVTAFRRIAGQISVDLCTGSTIDNISESIRQASDILVDGTQDPAKDCDGISVGLGFEAARVVVGDPAPPPAPSPDPCQ